MKKLKRTLFSMLAVIMISAIATPSVLAVYTFHEFKRIRVSKGIFTEHTFGARNTLNTSISIATDIKLLSTGGSIVARTPWASRRLTSGQYGEVHTGRIISTADGQQFGYWDGRVS